MIDFVTATLTLFQQRCYSLVHFNAKIIGLLVCSSSYLPMLPAVVVTRLARLTPAILAAIASHPFPFSVALSFYLFFSSVCSLARWLAYSLFLSFPLPYDCLIALPPLVYSSLPFSFTLHFGFVGSFSDICIFILI